MATIPINLIVCLLFGLTMAAAARTQILSGASPWQRELSLVLSFTLVAVAPTVAYFYWTYSDWSWMYLVDPGQLPTGTGLLVVVLVVLMVPLGFLSGYLLLRLLRQQGTAVLFALLGFLSTGLLLLLVIMRHRLGLLSSYEDFHHLPPAAETLAALPSLNAPLARVASSLPRSLTSPLTRSIWESKLPWAMLCTAPLVLACAVVVELSLWRYGRWLRQQAESVAKRSASGKVFPGPPSGKRRSSGSEVADREARSAAVVSREARSAAVVSREARSAAVVSREARSAAVADDEGHGPPTQPTHAYPPSR